MLRPFPEHTQLIDPAIGVRDCCVEDMDKHRARVLYVMMSFFGTRDEVETLI